MTNPPDGVSPPLPANRERRLLGLQLLVVVVVGAVLYGHTLHAPWYLDDLTTVVSPPGGHDLTRAVAGLFAQRGLANLTFALNYHVGGLDPVGYHLVNIAVHLTSAGLVLLLLRRVFPTQPWAAWGGALLFVAHPLQTQAVTYVVQRMTSLSALLFLLALYLFTRSRELLATGMTLRAPRPLACYLGALLAGGLAILAKETAVVLPLALYLFTRGFEPRPQPPRARLLVSLAPFLLLALIFIGLYLLRPLLLGHLDLDQLGQTSRLASLEGNSPLRYLATQGSVLWRYLRLLVLPIGQVFDYGYPLSPALLTVASVTGLLGVAGLVGLGLHLRQRQPAIGIGILWFFLTLAMESSFLPLDPYFEHRLYLPLFGLAMAGPALLALIPHRTLRHTLLLAALIACALLTWQRNALWNDRLAFYEDNYRRAPHNERVCNDLALLYLAAGRSQEAIPLLEQTLRNNPRLYKTPYLRLPDLYFRQGRLADARALLEESLRYFPDNGSFYNNLAILYLQEGNAARARAVLEQGIKVDPVGGKLQVTMGQLLLHQGAAAAAEDYVRQGIALGFATREVRELLAQALEQQGKTADAAQVRAASDPR